VWRLLGTDRKYSNWPGAIGAPLREATNAIFEGVFIEFKQSRKKDRE
jgi:hypothetical protein